MAISVGELVGTISLNDQFSGPINNVAKALGVSGESFRAVTGFAGLAAGAIVGTTASIVALGTRGAAVADVRSAFDGLTTAAGSTSDVMLGRLREGTLGAISDFDLMSKANSLLGAGMIKSADDMGTLAAGAQLLADRTGGETAAAFDTLSSAMATGRTQGLKQLGLFVDTKGAIQAYANALGVSVDKLTAEQRAEAISTATLAALKAQLDAAGPATADFGDQITRGKVAVQNFTDNLGVAIATSPVVAAGMDAIAKGVSAAFGGSQTDLVKTLMGFVNDFAIGLTYVAQVAVTGAGIFVTAWFGIKTVILGVITAVSGAATAIVTLVDGVVDLAMKVPGGAKVVGDLAQGTEQLRLRMEAATLSLASETAEAARGVTGNSDLHRTLDALGGGVLLARDAMEAARDATAGMTEKNTEALKPIQDMSTAVGLTAAQIKAMEEQTMLSLGLMAESWTNAANLQTELQNQISLLQTTGVQQRLLEMDLARQAEIAGIQHLAFEYPAVYDTIVAAITEKYGIMTAVAQGHFANVEQAANAAGFKTRAELQVTADNSRALYEAMVASGKFSAEEIRKAWQKAEEAKQAVTGQTTLNAVQQFDLIASSASSMLRSVFGKNKVAAIAAVAIDTAAAIVKTFAQFGYPWGLIPAAAMAATALVQMNKIRSTEPGFAMGTPDMSFLDFGAATSVTLHKEEAVINRKQGATLAEMVEDELKARDTRTSDEIRELREEMALDRRLLKIHLRDAVLLAGA